MKPFINPYRDQEGRTLRLNLDVPIDDIYAIRSVLLEQGDLQAAWGLFLNHLANYVRVNNYTIANRTDLIEYIYARLGTGGPYLNQVGRDERRPATRVRKVHKGPKNVTTVGGGEQTTEEC